MDFEEPVKPTPFIYTPSPNNNNNHNQNKTVLNSLLCHTVAKAGAQREPELELGWQKHLAFNGSEAVVKQCAEIILIRLGQSSCIMGLLSPPFSPHCAEHSHSFKHYSKQSTQCSLQPFKLACESIFTCGNS